MYRLGKYQLVARLGTGGMAEVWRARRVDEPDAPTVVVKRVLPGHAHDPAFVRSLRTEALVLTRLDHPGIVRLHALEELDGQLVLVLEHVDGCDLRTVARALPSPPPPGLGAHVMAEVCRALGHAHRFSGPILHRDVSPSNVMVTRDGEVKLVDFGIAKALFDAGDEATRSRSIKGKLSYMAPEQLEGQTLTCAADVYSAGVLLHELLTGRRLFTIASPLGMAVVHDATVEPPSRVNPTVPAGLDAICLRALSRAPSARFADGHDMAEALAPIAAELGFARAELRALVATALPLEADATAATATARAPRRSRRAAWMALAIAPLVVATAWIAWPHARVAAPSPPPPVVTAPPAIVATPLPAPLQAPHPPAKPAHKKPRPARPRLDDRALAPF